MIDNKPRDIYSVWCLIRSNNTNEDFFSVTGLGSGLTLEQAIKNAFTEAEGIYFSQKYLKRNFLGNEENAVRNILDENLEIYLSYGIMTQLNALVDNADIIKPIWNASKKRTLSVA